MFLSRTARSAAAHSASKTRVNALMGGLRSLTRTSTRTECCPCDQGRFLGRLGLILIGALAREKSRQHLEHRVRLLELRQVAGVGDHLDPRARNLFRKLPRINRCNDAIGVAPE